jgi:enamine deaminase RidA (YjgF/YER057c/UK114 family)
VNRPNEEDFVDRQYIFMGKGAAASGMSAAVRVGDIITVSGQVAMTDQGEIVGKDDPAAQVEQCFANLEAILQRANSSLADVVSVTAYLTSPAIARDFLAARGKYFPQRAPATTTVIAQLLHPDFLVEIQAMAIASTAAS